MVAFTLQLADIPIGVSCSYHSTKEYCADYLTDVEPAFSVTVSETDCMAERRFMKESCSLPYLELRALYRKICERLVAFNIILMHGSAIAVDGQVYIFIALSGTGKSTHTAFWREYLVPRGHEVVMVNDDKPLIAVNDKGIFACGTPWSGVHRLSANLSLPVKAICILERAQKNSIVSISPDEVFPVLYQQTYRPENPLLLTNILTLLGKLKHSVSFYRLGCTPSIDAAQTAYNTMKQGD